MELPDVIRSMLLPRTYPEMPSGIELRQTHISYLFFTPNFVYKIKKPVNFGFLDFTSLRKRHFYCLQELRLNRRLTEGVYIDVIPINRGREGIKIQGKGRTIEYAVKMKRLPERLMLNRMIENGHLPTNIVENIAIKIADFHRTQASSREISRFGLPHMLRKNVDENFQQTEGLGGRILSKRKFKRIKGYTERTLRHMESLLLQRVGGGYIKDLHGDIHSDHICITDGIQIFDCIEFNKRFRYLDVAADISFLAMDLDFYNRHDLSKVLITTYFDRTGDGKGIELLDFYKCYRAYVRGKVEGFKLREEEIPEAEKESSKIRAMRYFHLADLYATGGFRPSIIIVCGLTGTGKTTVARMLGEKLGIEVISSDLTRKELAGVPAVKRMPASFGKGIYSAEFTERTYNEIIRKGISSLEHGRSIILDATFSRNDHRETVIKKAADRGAKLYIIECTAKESAIRERLTRRLKDRGVVSDGRWEIYEKQKRVYDRIDMPHITVDTSLPVEDTTSKLLDCILN